MNFPSSAAAVPASRVRILHLEDSDPDAELVAEKLAAECPECSLQHASSRKEFERALEEDNFDLILSDYTLQGYDGLTALQLARSSCPRKPFIFLSGTIGEERAIEALKLGATDYVIKDRPSRLVPAIRQALARAKEEQRLRQTEEALDQNRERSRQITENVTDLILMLDAGGRCLYCNPAYAETIGRKSPAPSEYDMLGDVHEEDQTAVRELFQETLATGQPRRAEYRLLRADRSVRVVEAQNSPVRDSTGRATQVLVVARDVTERRAADERIRHQADLLNRAQDAILMRDMGDRITYWNQSSARIYGWSAEQAHGRKASELWSEDPAQVVVARRATLFYGEWTGDMRQRSPNGTDLIMQSRWSLVQGKDGSAEGFLIINTDIAEKKRLEAQLLRAQRTESIGLLAGGIAHDINNTLVPIIASTEMLETELSDKERNHYLATIRSSAQHGAALVKQILAFARGAAGEQTEVNLQAILKDFVGLVAHTLPRSIELTLECPKEPWPVRADATQLKQVLVNLCINSRDAMPAGGTILIRLENQLLGEAAVRLLPGLKTGPHVIMSVVDSGTGMSPEVVDRIFDPFYTTKELGKGTGLGLAAVQGIVKDHNGTITVESTPKKGSTFRIYIPATPAPTSAPEHAEGGKLTNGAGECILLVDDEPSVRNILSALLSSCGYRVIKASSGNEGLKLFDQRSREIGLVLTDVMMADGDGFSLLSALRSRNVTIPLIMMSGLAGNGQYEDRAKQLGASILSKPITRDALVAAITSALPAHAP